MQAARAVALQLPPIVCRRGAALHRIPGRLLGLGFGLLPHRLHRHGGVLALLRRRHFHLAAVDAGGAHAPEGAALAGSQQQLITH